MKLGFKSGPCGKKVRWGVIFMAEITINLKKKAAKLLQAELEEARVKAIKRQLAIILDAKERIKEAEKIIGQIEDGELDGRILKGDCY